VQLQDQVRAEELPFADGSYDHAACMGALLYFSDPRKAFTEIHRVMKPGGRLVIRNVNRDNLYTAVTGKKLDPASNNPYTEEELRALVQDTGFTVTNSFTYGFWPPFCIDYWWYLVNGPLPAWFQSFLARCTPRKRGVTVTVFAKRAP
jgi:SAM-dependent methyltransferase